MAVSNQTHFRIRSGDSVGLNADTGWAAIEDANATIGRGIRFRIRFKLTVGGGGAQNLCLQVRRNGGTYVDVHTTTPLGGTATPPSLVNTSSQFSDGAATSTELLTNGGGTYISGVGDVNNVLSTTLASGEETEVEFCLQIMATYDGENEVVAGDTLEYRVVNGTIGSNSPFGGTYVIPVITVADTFGYIGGTPIESPCRFGPYKDSNGNLYMVHEFADTNAVIAVRKSTDGGNSWRVVDGANNPTTADWEGGDVWQDGDTLHILYVRDNALYNTFRMSDHPTNPDQWGVIAQTASGGTFTDAANQQGALVARSDGTVVAVWSQNNTLDGVWYNIRSSGGTWGTPTEIDTEAVAFTGVYCVLGEADTTHIFYRFDPLDGTSTAIIYHRTLSAADSLSGRQAVVSNIWSQSGGDNDADCPMLEPVYYDDGGVEVVVVAYQKANQGQLFSRHLRDGTLQTEQTLTAVGIDTDRADNNIPIGSLCVDPATKTVHALFALTSNPANMSRDLNVDEGGWGTDTALDTAIVDFQYIRARVITHSAANGGDKVIGYIYDDGGGGGAGQLWYEEFILEEGVTTPIFYAWRED